MVPMLFLKHTEIHWWKHWELFTVMGNDSVGPQQMCGGVPDPLALWRSSVDISIWATPCWKSEEGNWLFQDWAHLLLKQSSKMDEMNWLLRSVYFSLQWECPGTADRDTALHPADMNRSCWQWGAQWATQKACVTAWPGLCSPVCTGSVASQMDGPRKLIWEDIHPEEWRLVIWNPAVGNILFGYVLQRDKRAVFGVGSFWINVCSPIISTGVNPYPGIQVDTNFYKLIQSGFKMDQPYYATKDV